MTLMFSGFSYCTYCKELARLKAGYILYSYDHNYIYAKENVSYNSGKFQLKGDTISISVRKGTGRAVNSIVLLSGGKTLYKADAAEFTMQPFSCVLIKFGKKISYIKVNSGKIPIVSKEIKYSVLKKSLLYFLGNEISIKNNLDVYGYNITAFVEGLPSFSFRSFRMNRGKSSKDKIVELNKLWYYNNYGILGDISINLKKGREKGKLYSYNNFRINHDLFNNLPAGPDTGITIGSQNVFSPDNKNTFSVKLDYIKDNMSQAVIGYGFKPAESFESNISVDLKDNLEFGNESWIRSMIRLKPGKKNSITLEYNHARSREYSGGINYLGQLGKNLQMNIRAIFSGIRNSDRSFNKRFESDLSLRYSTKLFNLSSEYSFNRESLYKKSLSSPKFSLSFLPMHIYGGLLDIEFSTSMILSKINLADTSRQEFSSNSVFGLKSKKVFVSSSLNFQFSLRSEIFFDRDPMENYISNGVIVMGSKRILKNFNFDLLYNYYTRRNSRNWMIEGTTASDISLFLRKSGGKRRADFWTSITYDIDSSGFRNSYMNLRLSLLKGWGFQVITDYDFNFKNFNYSLYLDRNAGRLKIRFSFRSITKQFQVEIIPN